MLGNTWGLVYGTIAIGALLAAETAQTETYLETLAGVLIALVIYWMAHAYSEFTAERLDRGEPLKLVAFGRIMMREISVLIGAAAPLLALVVFGITGASLTTAVNAAIWTSAGMILLIEVAAGLRADLSGADLIKQSSLGALMGFLMIALKLVLH
ncbi:MAG: hypothetical protein ACXVQR_08515 [Solirubrobacteraceae bacterium]